MNLAHLSDLHLRDENDAVEFGRQLDCIAARRVDHLVITGDLLDRWNPPLLHLALEALADRHLLDARTLTIIHGNHDLASSGGHPRQRSDLWRLALRFWDPPPLVARRPRLFHQLIAARAPGVTARLPFVKALDGGIRLAALDSVRARWTPFAVRRREVTLQHGRGGIEASQTQWLAAQREAGPLVVLVHHYPLDVGAFHWHVSRLEGSQGFLSRFGRWSVRVPMEIDRADRDRFWEAASAANVAAVLCGHVHRTRIDHHHGIAVGLNGQSGAEWAGRTVAYYRIVGRNLTAAD